MSTMSAPEFAVVRPDPTSHYNRVTDAWQYLIGADFHYGYFESANLSLEVATGALTKLLASRADLKSGMKVLDVGCGTGNPAVHIAKEHNCTVLGISTSEVNVRLANARAAAAKLGDQVRFEVRNGMATGLDSESFDCVWVQESSHLMTRKDLLLSECSRVLRPGGRLVLCDIVLLRPVFLHEVRAMWKQILVLDQVFGKAVMIQLTEYVRLAASAGCRVISQLDISRETLPTFESWLANANSHALVLTELLGSEANEQFRAACDILRRSWLDWLGYGLLVAERTGSAIITEPH